MSKFADNTRVPIGRSQDSIREMVMHRGATGWAIGEDGGQAVISFRMNDRLLRFRMRVPQAEEFKAGYGKTAENHRDKEVRRLWRALAMAIKAKLVIADEGIEHFDEVFLNNIVTNNGATVGEIVLDDVREQLDGGKARVIALLPATTRTR